MNKEKVMQAVYELSDLQSICSKSMRQKAINKVESEIDSKVVMPKVFDEWLTGLKKDKAWTDYFILKRLNLIFFENLVGSSNEHKIYYDWLCKNDKKDIKKYQKCVNAVLNGYEVEK